MAELRPVVVTGGAGAIGHLLVERLLATGAEVRVIDNLSSGRAEHLAAMRENPRLRLIAADLREPSRYADEFRGAGAVWHLAANPDIRLGTSNPSVDLEQGTMTTFRVLEAARTHDVRSVRFSSSSVVYGYPTVFPTPEITARSSRNPSTAPRSSRAKRFSAHSLTRTGSKPTCSGSRTSSAPG